MKRFTARSFEERTPRGEVVGHGYDASGVDLVTDGGRPTVGVRPPAVAGQFYAGDESGLHEQIENCFRHEYGPGRLEGLGGRKVTAVVSPHAGYPYSGPVAAHGYGVLASGPTPGSVVVLGPNHQGVGPDVAVSPHNHWRTPLGTAPVDGKLASAVVEESPVATFDERTHAGEHSLEVQIPFLQYCLEDVSVVPICLTRPGQDRARQFGSDLAAVIDRCGRDVAVVASTDLTHYEGHEAAVAADEPVTEAIRRLDTDAVSEAVRGGHTMCGPWATVATLTAAKHLGVAGGDLLQYATSGETAGRRDRVVGYCSAVF
ncbi:MAG: AmmeMemoRadiSam system protein B [Haloarculaceae archaeon]